ncbi:hypothetical protein SUGI_0666410 [Cryptomeria japonica]|nr:hypothetical protein SUGI_0666410 [Cryptomeria japonica]
MEQQEDKTKAHQMEEKEEEESIKIPLPDSMLELQILAWRNYALISALKYCSEGGFQKRAHLSVLSAQLLVCEN